MGYIEDTEKVREVCVEVANDPEKFSEWEQEFSDSLRRQVDRNGDGFSLSFKQKEVVNRMLNKAKGIPNERY